MEDTSQKLNWATGAIFIVAVLVLVYLAAVRSDSGPVAEVPKPAISINAVDAAYGKLGGFKELKLAENFESWTPEAKLSSDKTVAKSFVIQGQVAQAYLLIKASEGSDALTKWDSIYFKLNDLGGHLFRPSSLKVPDAAGTTLLYDLRQVAVLPNIPYDESRTPENADLVALLKDGHRVVVTSFISSLRQGSLDQLSLYYVCAEGQDCKLELK